MKDAQAEKGVQDVLSVLAFFVICTLGPIFLFLIGTLVFLRFVQDPFYRYPRYKIQNYGKQVFKWGLGATFIAGIFYFVSDATVQVPIWFGMDMEMPRALPFVIIFFEVSLVGLIFWRTGGRLFRANKGSVIIAKDVQARLKPEDFKYLPNLSKTSQDAPIGLSVLDGQPIQYPFNRRNYHMFIMGGTGMGKTTLIKALSVNAIHQKQPVVIIDPKGSAFNLAAIRKFALSQGVPPERFFVFSIPNPTQSCFYNPIKNANTTAKKDRIMEALNWSEQFYQSRASDYLTLVMPILELYKLGNVTLSDVRKCLTDEKFMDQMDKVFCKVAQTEGVDRILKQRCLDASKSIASLKKFEGAEGLKSQLVILDQSDFGYLLSPELEGAPNLGKLWKESCQGKNIQTLNQEATQKLSEVGIKLQAALQEMSFLSERPKQEEFREIDLADLIENGGFVYFQLSIMQAADTARRIGRVVLEDLKGVANRIQSGKQKAPSLLPVFIDEFGEFASKEFGVFQEQSRDALFALHLFFQGVGNLDEVSPAFRNRMIDSSAEKIILSTLSPEGAELAANMAGTEDALEQSRQTVGFWNWSIPTGLGNQRQTKQMRVEHDVFKRLSIGQAVVIRKFPENKVDLVQIWNPDLEEKEDQKEKSLSLYELRLRERQKLLSAGHGNFDIYRAWNF